ncbi:ECF-type sigma factor [Saltatorellus ferox]
MLDTSPHSSDGNPEEEPGQGSVPADPGNDLFIVLYNELRAMAERAMSGQPAEHTLQPTALVNEAYLRVMAASEQPLSDRTHFLSVAARVMRNLLVDHARKKSAGKRASSGVRVELDSVLASFEESAEDIEALDFQLTELAKRDPQMAQAIELRFFAGASVEETAEAVGLSVRTLERKWKTVRVFLRSQMGEH